MNLKYTKKNFVDLVVLIKDGFEYNHHNLHEEVVEFYLPNHNPLIRLFRLIYSAEQGDIIVSFSVEMSSTDAVSIFTWIRDQYKLVAIGPEFFIDREGNTHTGQEALAALTHEMEGDIVEELATQEEIAVDGPVSHFSEEPIYHAGDPRALEQFKKLHKKKYGVVH